MAGFFIFNISNILLGSPLIFKTFLAYFEDNMPLRITYQSFRFVFTLSVFCLSLCHSTLGAAQSKLGDENIDPLLVEIIQIVKSRASETPVAEKPVLTQDEIYLNLLDKMGTAFYTQNSDCLLYTSPSPRD